MRWLFILVFFFMAACSREQVLSGLKNETLKVEEQEAVERLEGIKTLFCFKCHSYEKFQGISGKFPHEKHRDLFHCNQCHELKMHQSIKTDTGVCKDCHSLGRFVYQGTGMKTFFDHASHSKRSSCRDCHPGVFVMKRGMNRITMDDINKGQSCGVCHNGKKAFSADNCTACHEM